ncbi:MAG: APC family permease [Bacteroidota bacterium]
MMKAHKDRSTIKGFKLFFIGKARDLYDEQIFHRVTLIAFFAWIGLGSDGLSSSCYGPEESFRVLGHYPFLAIIVALLIALTIFIIGSSYSQIIKLFPSGGGGYKVATKLLSSKVGMVSGSALLVDYILTIAMSISASTDALFSMIPSAFQPYKLGVSIFGILILIILNFRGVKESVFSLMPIFILFVVSHLFVIGYAIFSHLGQIPAVYHDSVSNFKDASQTLGTFGVLALILRSYSMGAGTYTGLEAVSNSVPILQEPRVKTGLTTMRYMIFSLAITVVGLMFAYVLFNVHPSEYKTLNAVLLDNFTASWGKGWSWVFISLTLFSEAMLLFIAAQTGFLDGPRVIASMAQDNWFPRRFTVLSDRLVTQNGISFMGIMAIVILILTKGSIRILVILYSINVFITFALSQAGMVRHWWLERKTENHWKRKLIINGIGLFLTVFILFTVISMKFMEGGWITLVITGLLILVVTRIKKHYNYSNKLITRMNNRAFHCVDDILSKDSPNKPLVPVFDANGRVAVICVKGYNGLGINTFFKVRNQFREYTNFIFIEVGIVDAGNFKGQAELQNLEDNVKENLANYENLARHCGFYAESHYAIGTDIADEVKDMAKNIIADYPHAIFFIGQFIIPKATAMQRMLHNQAQVAIQNRLAHKGYIMVMVPIRSHANV